MVFAVIGYAAGFCTTISFVPQVVRAWRTRHADDIAWGWLIIFEVGLGLWLTYGVIVHNWPMILANSVTLTLCTMLIVMKYRFAKSAPKLAQAETGH
ncbi:MAG TPA: SemiSWEET transporter [Terriglobales bacterium]|nr:SemiSWEET transporter [Terriglobales bacterium]